VKGEQMPFVMELPVYHVPTIRGVMMHTWTRTWLYIKKAGTIILAVSVLLWALMYFPRADVSDLEQAKTDAKGAFCEQMKTAAPQLKLEKPADVDSLVEAVASARAAWDKERDRKMALKADDENALFAHRVLEAEQAKAVAKAAKSGEKEKKAAPEIEAYFAMRGKTAALDDEEARRRLMNSFAGKIGSFLSPLSRLAGFDWKLNIALIGGFAAKEVVIGTLGTAYSLGNVDPDDAQSVSEKLAEDPDWNPLKAFALMVFVMLYAPCVATLAVIKKETGSWGWTIFSTAYSTALAFLVAAAIYQIGSLL
jgi:ferrous iron transport protein B